VIHARPATSWIPVVPPVAALAAARLDRSLDSAWRRTSYSALTAAAHDDHPGVGSEPEISQTDDEGSADDLPATVPSEAGDPDEALREIPSLWDALPSGANFGTLVHALLEVLDDPADNAVVAAVTAQATRSSSALDPSVLTEGLISSLATPLGPLAGDIALRDVRPADRLRELDFELPLSGGDERATGRPLITDLVPLWRRHCPTGPLSDYADALAALEPAPLRGYLTGSIDVVLRVGSGRSVRYLVVDYKTNRLGAYDEPLTLWHYRPEALERAMIDAHYPLQSLLYAVALHRYLRWRQPAYDPEVHLGGALYLFLRGMPGPGVTGADGSVPGVFSWRPPSALVTEVSDLLAGGSP
jgi:exodeoxyribonuclease V beta subunit